MDEILSRFVIGASIVYNSRLSAYIPPMLRRNPLCTTRSHQSQRIPSLSAPKTPQIWPPSSEPNSSKRLAGCKGRLGMPSREVLHTSLQARRLITKEPVYSHSLSNMPATNHQVRRGGYSDPEYSQPAHLFLPASPVFAGPSPRWFLGMKRQPYIRRY